MFDSKCFPGLSNIGLYHKIRDNITGSSSWAGAFASINSWSCWRSSYSVSILTSYSSSVVSTYPDIYVHTQQGIIYKMYDIIWCYVCTYFNRDSPTKLLSWTCLSFLTIHLYIHEQISWWRSRSDSDGLYREKTWQQHLCERNHEFHCETGTWTYSHSTLQFVLKCDLFNMIPSVLSSHSLTCWPLMSEIWSLSQLGRVPCI